ncbi:acyltransferase family protein [Desertivirga brevis]|uniref:acyltransferase family protein n=1 Tax=Desertivirga brevis TaxID=2810310 RepID=UPI001A95E36B
MKRSLGLDLLRGLAVILVLFRHFEISSFLTKIGWMGVDLFFVLSGFLVSGLLFRELSNTGKINISRFLVRRGLKIYPSFYFFLIVSTFLIPFNSDNQSKYLHEVLFLQSYLPRIWDHTWSLSVEEHFYLLLIIIVPALNLIKTYSFSATFQTTCLAIILISLSLRLYSCSKGNVYYLYYQTHFRLDSFAFGMLLSFWYSFKREFVNRVLKQYKIFILALSIVCFLPFLYFPVNSVYISGPGFSLLMIVFGVLVLYLHDLKFDKLSNLFLTPLFRMIGFIGLYSYNIYLWHLPVAKHMLPYIQTKFTQNLVFLFIIYFIASIFLGWFISVTLEKRILNFRNRYYPNSGEKKHYNNSNG